VGRRPLLSDFLFSASASPSSRATALPPAPLLLPSSLLRRPSTPLPFLPLSPPLLPSAATACLLHCRQPPHLALLRPSHCPRGRALLLPVGICYTNDRAVSLCFAVKNPSPTDVNLLRSPRLCSSRSARQQTSSSAARLQAIGCQGVHFSRFINRSYMCCACAPQLVETFTAYMYLLCSQFDYGNNLLLLFT
jgi:hypothetical protein